MGDSEEELITDEAPPESKRGRPAGKSDSTQRSRRAAQEISVDKIRIAQMKLNSIRSAEERKFAMDNGIKMYNELASGDTQISLEEVIADKNKSEQIDFSETSAAGDQITMASESEKIARANALQKKKLDIQLFVQIAKKLLLFLIIISMSKTY